MSTESESTLMTRAAWLYYVGGFTQLDAAKRLGLTRARVNRLLQDARETGIVSISIDDRQLGLLPVEEKIRQHYGLQECICTPPIGIQQPSATEPAQTSADSTLASFARRAVGAAASRTLAKAIAEKPTLLVGTGWGRTLQQITRHLAGLHAPQARFVSLMGSLTANSSFNPFEVVQALAHATGGEGYFLPVPFIADTARDRKVLLSQSSVSRPLALARQTELAFISIGELTQSSLLRQQGMLTDDDLRSLRDAGAVGDTNGIFFDQHGKPIKHELNKRTLGIDLQELKETRTIILSAGFEKLDALDGLLNSGVASGLIIDGDSALSLEARL